MEGERGLSDFYKDRRLNVPLAHRGRSRSYRKTMGRGCCWFVQCLCGTALFQGAWLGKQSAVKIATSDHHLAQRTACTHIQGGLEYDLPEISQLGGQARNLHARKVQGSFQCSPRAHGDPSFLSSCSSISTAGDCSSCQYPVLASQDLT